MSAYRELAPPAPLAEWVACAWVSTRASGHVLPDGCADVVWTGSRLIIAGPATRSHVSTDAPGRPKIGVRFRVGAVGAALGLPADELLDHNPLAADVIPGGAVLTARLESAETPGRVLMELTAAVAARVRDARPADALVRAAALALTRPEARVRDVASALGVSERQLRRRFDAAVGYGPKTLARVLRFRRAVRAIGAAGAGASWTSVAYDAGYVDQSHLIREFRTLAGVTPARYAAERGVGIVQYAPDDTP